jgi:hypothetical protein
MLNRMHKTSTKPPNTLLQSDCIPASPFGHIIVVQSFIVVTPHPAPLPQREEGKRKVDFQQLVILQTIRADAHKKQ